MTIGVTIDQRENIEDREAAGDQALQQHGEPGQRLGHLGAEHVAQPRYVLGRQTLLQQFDQMASWSCSERTMVGMLAIS